MILSVFPFLLLTSPIHLWHRNLADDLEWEHMQQRAFTNPSSGASLREDIYRSHPLWERVRITQFSRRNRNQSMVNSQWYPHPDYDAPILMIDAADFAVGKSLLLVNVFDASKVDTDSLRRLLQWEENREFVEPQTAHLKNMRPLLTDGTLIYSHVYDEAKRDRAMTLLQKYLDEYMSLFEYRQIPRKRGYTRRKSFFDRARLDIEKKFVLYQDAFDEEALHFFLEKELH